MIERLVALGVDARVGHHPELAARADVVALSSAIGADDPEVVAAQGAGVPVCDRATLLPALCAPHRTIVVSGTHGKTTTSAMVLTILRAAGLDPSGIVGGDVAGLGGGAVAGTGLWFVLEGDESDGSFLGPTAEVALVTNIESDHLEHHGSQEVLEGAFRRFLAGAGSAAVVCADDPAAMRVASGLDHVVTYGTAADADYRVVDLALAAWGSSFTVEHRGVPTSVELGLPGRHYALDAAGAIAAVATAGVDPSAAAAGLASFRGVARRLEPRGEVAGVTFVDSYAHLPAEVIADVAALRAGPWRRLVVVFQPHRYTRTQALWRQFGDAFDDADKIVVTDVYPAGQAPIDGVSGKLVVDAVLDRHPWRSVAWMPRLDDVEGYLVATLAPGDLCLTLGAGDLTVMADRVQRALLDRAGQAS